MPKPTVIRAAVLALAVAASVAGAAAGTPATKVGLEQLAIGLNQPVYLTHAGDGSGRLFVVEKPGRIRVFVNGQLLATPFLAIESRVEAGDDEQGLLSVAFHPSYETNGRFFVYYTAGQADDARVVVAEYRASASDPNVADTPERVVLSVPHADSTRHNGGLVKFGPDGYLYVGIGDGGIQGDPTGNAQSLMTRLGKILRIDVDGDEPYEIPPDNPFVSTQNAQGEIYAYGFRNPWRYSFDRETGELWLGDVGQFSFEEIDIVRKGGNYGWRVMEGEHCYPPGTECDMSGLELPVFEYAYDGSNGVPSPPSDPFGCSSITGGYVYRGTAIPELRGVYVFGDYCRRARQLFGIHEGDDTATAIEAGGGFEPLTSFGEDEAGELYVLTDSAPGYLGGSGRVLRIVPVAATSLTPSSSRPGRALKVTIEGANLAAGATVSFGEGITVRSVKFVSRNKLRVKIRVEDTAPGSRDVTVTNPGGPTVTCIGCFRVK